MLGRWRDLLALVGSSAAGGLISGQWAKIASAGCGDGVVIGTLLHRRGVTGRPMGDSDVGALVGSGIEALVGSGIDALVGSGIEALVGSGIEALVGSGLEALVEVIRRGFERLSGSSNPQRLASSRATASGAQ
jgi:hypothetical protein